MNAVVSAPVIKGRLGILAGRGNYPVLVARAARELAHNPYIFAIKEEADQDWSDYDTALVGIGDLSTFIQIVRREGIGAVVMAGGISRRPGIRDIRPTWTALKSAPKALRALLSGGDDRILRAAMQMLERHDIRVLGAHEIAPDLLGQSGPLGDRCPDQSDRADIAAATQAAIALGRLDVGQGAVAVGGRVVALEGLEGTDAMLSRVAGLRADGRLRARSRGVLVKLCKPGQELRADLPAIGPATVRNAQAAGLSGIGIEAGRSLVLDRAEVIAEANRLGLFVTGLDLPSTGNSA
ncbi:MAG: UDP-2,3-diacylglucosamine diphosphatase LpxI [Hoeflea sp.]|uniref:LpxI family protein n=1 Tax=Hoeflea sp. TaxID=1940281 RepID=UPI0032EF0B07